MLVPVLLSIFVEHNYGRLESTIGGRRRDTLTLLGVNVVPRQRRVLLSPIADDVLESAEAFTGRRVPDSMPRVETVKR